MQSNKKTSLIAVVQHISEACSCPFYVKDASDKHFCFIKSNIGLANALRMVSESRDITQEDWSEDCSGSWDNCHVLPLLYDYEEADVDPNARDIADDYNPFSDSDEDDEPTEVRTLNSFTPPAIAEQEAVERAEAEQEDYAAGLLEYASDATFSIHQVSDPYRVKCDAILVPVNNLLEPMDLMLTRHCGAYFETARRTHNGPITTGEVYPLKSPYPNISARSIVYRGAVAGVQSINVVEIEDSVRKTLYLAENAGIATLAMMPMDFGGYDIELTAQAQISTIHEFLVATPTRNLKHIVILIPDDLTMDVFEEYQKRIFNLE